MDLITVVVAVVILLVLVGAVAAVALDVGGPLTAPVRERARSWLGARPDGRARRGPRAALAPSDGRATAGTGAVAPRPAAPAAPGDGTGARPSPPAPAVLPTDPRADLDRWREELRAELREGWRAAGTAGEERAARLERRLDELAERLARGLEASVGRIEATAAEARREAEARAEALAARLAAEEGRREAGLERLRADLGGRIAARAAAPGADRLAERRAEAIAELYARLARLEAALAAVTNPILLPGEPYAPPAELPADALVWENWKDVGERVFAFAEQFNAQRLVLPDPLAGEVAAFVATLREALTRSIYPNLRAHPSAEQRQTLRAALERLAAELPALRTRLGEGYRALAEPGAAGGREAG
jgi:hypothetical protein